MPHISKEIAQISDSLYLTLLYIYCTYIYISVDWLAIVLAHGSNINCQISWEKRQIFDLWIEPQSLLSLCLFFCCSNDEVKDYRRQFYSFFLSLSPNTYSTISISKVDFGFISSFVTEIIFILKKKKPQIFVFRNEIHDFLLIYKC